MNQSVFSIIGGAALASVCVLGAGCLPAYDAATRERVLRAVEETSPAFFSALVAHAYRGYYTLPEVQLAVGFTDRAPQPDGYVLPVFREELLKVQLKREPFWRKAE